MMMLNQLSMPSTMSMFGAENTLQKSPYVVGLPEGLHGISLQLATRGGFPNGPCRSAGVSSEVSLSSLDCKTLTGKGADTLYALQLWPVPEPIQRAVLRD